MKVTRLTFVYGLTCYRHASQVFLTREYLAISMEFAQGGDLFAYTLGPKSHGRLAEAQARWIFQQLILGLDYCHRKVMLSCLPAKSLILCCCCGRCCLGV